MIQEAYYYWGLSAIVYIATCYIFSAVRWFHTCDKPKESHEYIWPDRKAQAIVYLLSSILIPYIFNPKDENAWLLWKCYFPVTYYFYCGMLLFCFFGSVKQWNQWKGVTWLAGAIVALTMTPLIINAWIPGSILQPDKWGGQFYLWIAAAISILMMCYCAVAMWQVWKWMQVARDVNYSNPEDFPSSYAHRVWLAPVFFTPFLWAGFISDFFTDGRNVMFWMNLVLSVMNIILLITVMPAWRRAAILPGREEESTATYEDSFESKSIMEDRMNKIAKFIDEYVNQQQAYLNPHLKIENVVNGCGYSRTYVSKTFQERFGGFFNYVNSLRLAHYDRYAAEHPAITKEATAQASGFTSYQSYYKVRERMKVTHNPT